MDVDAVPSAPGDLVEARAVGEVEQAGPCEAQELRNTGYVLVGVQDEVGGRRYRPSDGDRRRAWGSGCGLRR